MQTALTVQNDREISTAAYLDDWRTTVIDSCRCSNGRCIVTNTTLTVTVITASVYSTRIYINMCTIQLNICTYILHNGLLSYQLKTAYDSDHTPLQ